MLSSKHLTNPSKPQENSVISRRPTTKHHRSPFWKQNPNRIRKNIANPNRMDYRPSSQISILEYKSRAREAGLSIQKSEKMNLEACGNRSVPTKEVDFGFDRKTFVAKYQSLGQKIPPGNFDKCVANHLKGFFHEDKVKGFRSLKETKTTDLIQQAKGKPNSGNQLQRKFFEIKGNQKYFKEDQDLARRTLARGELNSKNSMTSIGIVNDRKNNLRSQSNLAEEMKFKIRVGQEYTFAVGDNSNFKKTEKEKIKQEEDTQVSETSEWKLNDTRMTRELEIGKNLNQSISQSQPTFSNFRKIKIKSLRKPLLQPEKLGFFRQKTKTYASPGVRSVIPKSLHYFGTKEPKDIKIKINPDMSPICKKLALKIRNKNSDESESDPENKKKSNNFRSENKILEEKSSFSIHSDFLTGLASRSYFNPRDSHYTPCGSKFLKLGSREIQPLQQQSEYQQEKNKIIAEISRSVRKSNRNHKPFQIYNRRETGLSSLCLNNKRNAYSTFSLTSKIGQSENNVSLIDRWKKLKEENVPEDPLYKLSQNYFFKKKYRKVQQLIPKRLINLKCKKTKNGYQSFWLYEDEKRHVKFPKHVKNNIVDHEMDDDCETDEEHLYLGRRQCIQDFKEALHMNLLMMERFKRRRAYSAVNNRRRRRQSQNNIMQRALNNVRAMNTFRAKKEESSNQNQIVRRNRPARTNNSGGSIKTHFQSSRGRTRETSLVKKNNKSSNCGRKIGSRASTTYSSKLNSKRNDKSKKNKKQGQSTGLEGKGRWKRVQRNIRSRAYSTIPNREQEGMKRYFQPKIYRKKNKIGL